MWKSRRSNDLAIIDDQGTSWTHRELFKWVLWRSMRLDDVAREEHVGLVLTNEVPSLVYLLALQHAGALPVILDPKANREQWRDALDQIEASRLVVPVDLADPSHGDTLLSRERPAATNGEKDLDCEDFLTAGTPGIAFIMPTSGTTGAPKLVPIDYGQLLASAEASRTLLQIESTDHWLSPLSLAHMGGISVVYRTLIYGTSMTLLGDFDADSTWRHLTESRTSRASLVPTMLHRMCAHSAPTRDLTHLRTVLIGGAAADAATLDKAIRWGLPVCPTYGMTETCSQIATRTPWSSAPLESVGVSLPGTEVVIRDESGDRVPTGTSGLIWVRGPSVVTGYVGQHKDDRARFQGGWFQTGDRGHLDPDGHLFIVGRSDDVIVCGATNLDPVRIEAAVRRHAAIHDAAVFSLADQEWGERVVAAVTVADKKLPADLFEHCRTSLTSLEVPSGWYVVDQIPQGRSGKIDRRGLKETLCEKTPISAPDAPPPISGT
jgi:o-succinylbenzoate---CoA ligase